MKISRHLRVLTGPLQVSFGRFCYFLTAASDASLLPSALAYSFCCLDDRALRRHIHFIPRP